jgi:peptidoglycan biosynthesis protein MviN/MurJ (putative lipid II flippase)
VSIANAAMVAVLLLVTPPLTQWLAHTPLERAVYLAVTIMAAAVTYGAALWLAGLRLQQLRNRGGAEPS